MFRIYLELYRKNIKIFLIPAVLSVVLLVIILLVVFDVRNSGEILAARICQQFFALAGVLLMPPVFMPEKRDNIEETILSKTVPVKAVHLIRVTEALLTLILFTAGFVFLLSFLGSDIEFKRYFIHTFATALILGSIGFAGTRLTGNIGAGYIIALGFYMLQMFLPVDRIEIAAYFYVFTLLNEVNNIAYIYICAFILIVISFIKKH